MDVASRKIRFGDCLVEPELNRLTVGTNECQIEPGAMDVLVFLLEHAGQVVSAEVLRESVWAGRVVEDSSIHKRISQIRHALHDEPQQARYIASVSRRGYTTLAPVEFLNGEDRPQLRNAEKDLTLGRSKLAIIPLRDLSKDQQLGWLAGGVTEQLHDQISAWRQFDLVPSALSRGKSVDNLAKDTDLIIDGYLQPDQDSVAVALNVIDAKRRSNIWSSTFHGHQDDPYELQNQIVSSIARFFGESLGGNSQPSRPEAYLPYLKLLNLRYFGDADENIHWLEKTLEADPDWSWGWADLAINLMTRSAAARSPELLDRSKQILRDAPRVKDSEAMFGIADLWRLAFCEGDFAGAEKIARQLVSKGNGLGYGMLMTACGLHLEAEALFRYNAERKPYRPITWEWLTVARAYMGNWESALESARRVVALFPPESPNALIIASWAMRGSERIEEALSLCDELQSRMLQM
ncbi:MAG: winged helix-turn-helix domain-containing protein, partial [Pseudomonadales bacterium]